MGKRTKRFYTPEFRNQASRLAVEIGTRRCCDTLEVNRTSYYARRSRPESPRDFENTVLLAHIHSIKDKTERT